MHALKIAVPSQSEGATKWEGWGTSLAWWAHAVGCCPTVRQQLCKLLFDKDPDVGLGLNIVRYNIGGACPAHVDQYRTAAAVPCLRLPNGSYEWQADKAQLAVLLESAALGVDTFEAFSNSPPWFWTVSGNSRGHLNPYHNNLAKQHINDFAAFCADVVAYFDQQHGIKIHSLSPFNEPASPAWCLRFNNKQEGCYFSKPRAHKVLQAMCQQPALQDTKIVAFEQFCCRDTLSDLNHLPRDLWRAVGRINMHTYTSKEFFQRPFKPLLLWQDNSIILRRLLRRRLLHKTPTPLWISEFGTGRGAIALAKHVLKDLATLRPSAWVYWQAVESLASNWGLLEAPLETYYAAGTAATSVCEDREAGVVDTTTPGSSVTAAAASASAARADGVSNSEACSSSSSSSSDPLPHVIVHSNYFVLHFLMQCIPKGCSYMPLKGLGKRGVVAFHTDNHAVLVYLNTNDRADQSLSINAAEWAGRARVGSTTQQADGFAPAQDQVEDAVLAQLQHAAESVADAATSSNIDAGRNAATTCAQRTGQHVSCMVRTMNVKALRSICNTELVASSISNACRVTETVRDIDLTDGWLLVVQVPAGFLCRIDLVL